ncbi:hypothetical protein MRX96_020771 [Rhipicephalus microplus]
MAAGSSTCRPCTTCTGPVILRWPRYATWWLTRKNFSASPPTLSLTPNRVVMKLRMVHLDMLTPNVSSHRWLKYLNKHLHPHHLVPSDNLLLVDMIVTTTISMLFEGFSNADLLDQLAWGFIDEYSFTNSYTAAVATYGDEEAVARFVPGMCYMITENRFRRRIFFERSVALGGSIFLGSVTAIFEKLRNTTQRLISEATTWIDAEARTEAVAIAAKLHRLTFPGWPVNDTMLHRHSMYSFLVEYEYWWNTVYVNPAMAAPPFFYVGAPASVNYGGLGAAVARQLVRSFDPKMGSFMDSKRRVRSWMSRTTRKALEQMVSCVAGRSGLLMQVASAQVAYRAYREQSEDKPSRYVINKNVSLTPDMLFFVTLCRTMCGMDHLCSLVLRNMAAFARAFSCKPHTPMNPSRRCHFFNEE